MEPDELSTLRCCYHVGDYKGVLAEAASLQALSDPQLIAIRDFYVFRAHVAAGQHSLVSSQIGNNAPVPLQLILKLSDYLQATEDEKRQEVLQVVQEWLKDDNIANDPFAKLIAAQIYFEAEDFKSSLQLVHDVDSLEMQAIAVQIYLKLNRLDVAETALKRLEALDDDDAVSVLSQVSVRIVQGGDKLKETNEMLQDLIARSGATVKLLNILGIVLMHQGSYLEAFGYLKQARDLAIKLETKPTAETFVNSIACLQHLRKSPKIIERVVAELREAHPKHPFLQTQDALNEQFDKLVAYHKKK